MHGVGDTRCQLRCLLIGAFCAVAALTTIASADVVNVGTIPYNDATIENVDAGELVFRSSGGTELRKAIDPNLHVEVVADPALTDAENLHKAGKFADAVDKYRTLMTAGSQQWIKDYAAIRLLDSANRGGVFDQAVKAWIALGQKDPSQAMKTTLAVPTDPKSSFLPAAAKDLQSAADNAKDSGFKVTCLKLLKNIYTLTGDDDNLTKTVEAIATVEPGNPSQKGDIAIMKIRRLYAAKSFGPMLQMIVAEKANFIEPQQQADAFYYRAEGEKAGLGASPTDDDMKDVALDYYRSFQVAPRGPHAADDLMNVAALQERYSAPAEAVETYFGVASEYRSNPLAATAKAALDRLAGDNTAVGHAAQQKLAELQKLTAPTPATPAAPAASGGTSGG